MKTSALVGAAILAVLLAAYWWRTANADAGKADAPDKPTAQAQIVPAAISQPTSVPAATPAPAPQPSASTTTANSAAEVEQRLGPFSIAGKQFTAVLRKQLPAGAKAGEGQTVVSMEIRDSAGTPQFSRAFSNEGGGDGFISTVSVSVIPFSGATGNGLLVGYDEDSEPSAPEPESSGWWQVFGVVDGKLRAFSGPVQVVGDLLPADNSARALAPGATLTAPGDILQFKVWAGRFRLIFPVRIDWAQGKLSPARPCDKAATTPDNCVYAVVPEDQRNAADLTFVRLCASPMDACQKPERAVVKRTSNVELLAARVETRFDPGKLTGWSGDPKNAMSDAGGISLTSQDPWLKVRIDGKEGWLHGQEDLDALGMPSEQ